MAQDAEENAGNRTENESQPISDDYPDGGVRAWLTVFGTWCFNVTSFGWASGLGVFHAYFSTNQLKDYSQSSISWISSADLFVLLFFAPIAGRLFDSYGPRVLLIVGSTMHILGLVCLSFSTQYYQIFLSESILSGIGASTLYYASLNAVSTYFKKKRAFAIAIVGSGASLGGIIIPIIFDSLIARGVEYGWTLRIVALTFLVLLAAGNLSCTSRLVHQAETPRISDFFRPFREVEYTLLSMGGFFTFFVLFVPNTYLPNYARLQGASETLATSTLIVLNASSLVGRVLCGLLADHFGRMNAIVCSTAAIVVSLTLWIPATTGTLMAFSACYGFTSGAFISLMPPVTAQISQIQEIGVRTGMIYGVASFSCLTGIPIAGALLFPGEDGKLSYKWLQVFCIVAIGVGTCSLTTMRFVHCRKICRI